MGLSSSSFEALSGPLVQSIFNPNRLNPNSPENTARSKEQEQAETAPLVVQEPEEDSGSSGSNLVPEVDIFLNAFSGVPSNIFLANRGPFITNLAFLTNQDQTSSST